MKSLIRVFALSAVLVVGIPAVSALWFGEPTYIFSELLSGTVSAQALKVEGPSTATTKPQDTNVCDLKNDPAKYNHAVVKVSGYFSRGFENSSLYDPSCNSNQSIWVELGGRRSVNVIYCCGVAAKSTRKKEMKVEGIKLPLTEDTNFARYNKLLAGGREVKATVIGTFFSGEKMQFSKDAPAFYGGYGHFGMNSLFVVQQVISAEPVEFGNPF